MADTCIVCLVDLRTSVNEDRPPEAPAACDHAGKDDAKNVVDSNTQRPIFPHNGGLIGAHSAIPSSVFFLLGRLEDLDDIRRISLEGEVDPASYLSAKRLEASSMYAFTTFADPTFRSVQADDEAIAHLLPCKHDLHNSCLKPWVERANSCPICRAVFNMVEVSRTLGGPVEDSYAVQDKVQEAEIDANMIAADELVVANNIEPCVVCGVAADGHGTMWCDGCAHAVHVFCAGFDDAPEVWYCETCHADLENDTDLRQALDRRPRRNGVGNGTGRSNNTAPPRSRPPHRRRTNDALWARVWQEVSQRLDLDLDFPFDEEPALDQRTEEQRREFQRWQRRFEVANRQGASNRLRGIAQARLNPERAPEPNPESQDEIRAWNAFDKARESQDAPPTIRRRPKRRASQSPVPHDEEQSDRPPQLKRPRLRRPPGAPQELPESSNAAGRRHTEEPTFLSSLLREVENKTFSAASPATSDQLHGQQSPRNSSPVRSPVSSECGSPRLASTTPPQRPLSPPLSSTILPVMSPLAQTFSPFSPAASRDDLERPVAAVRRGRRRQEEHHLSEDVALVNRQSASPSRLSYSAKEEIQRMVKLALGARYRDKEISKDQYTDINRDVSRKMYELVQDASALADQQEREKWQNIAHEEVQKAVVGLSSVTTLDEL